MTTRTFTVLTAALFAAGLTLRLVGTGWGEPHGYHYDERFVLAPALRIVESGDPNPHFFNYPSALIYASTAVVWLHSVAGDMPLDLPRSAAYGPADLGPWTWPALRDARRMVALVGALGMLAAGLLAYRTGGREAALAATALVAAMALHAEHSHFLTTDVPMTTLLVTAFALGARPRGGPLTGLISGAALGLAVATKYTAGFALAPLVVVNALAGCNAIRSAGVIVGAALAFVAACPFAVLDWQRFTADLTTVRDHYRSGHLGAEGDGNWAWYLMRMRQDGLGATGMALFAIGLAGVVADAVAARGDRAGRRVGAVIACVVAATALAWFLWLGSVRVRFERNLIPAATLAATAAGHGLAALLALLPRLAGRFSHRAATAARSVAVAALVLALLAPAALATRRTLMLAGGDTRSQAAAWIQDNVAAGSTIVREEYTPRPDPDRFRVVYVWSLSQLDPTWYTNNDVDYVVASSSIHARLRAAGNTQATDRYRSLFRWPRAAGFAPGARTSGPLVTVIEVPRRPRADG